MITFWNILNFNAGSEKDLSSACLQGLSTAVQTAGMTGFRYDYVTDSRQRGVNFPRCDVSMDGMLELEFDSLQSMNKVLAPESRELLAKLVSPLADNSCSLTTVRNRIIPLDESRPLVHRVSFITRRPSFSPDRFRDEWWYVHGKILHDFKGLHGYYQNLVIDRTINGVSVPYEQLPIDGIVELYFDDVTALEADFASEYGQKASRHAATFLEKISTYIVETKPVVN